MLTFEAYNGYETASLKQLNNWRVDFQLKERWSLSLGVSSEIRNSKDTGGKVPVLQLRVLPTVIVMSGAVALVYFSMKEKVAAYYTFLFIFIFLIGLQ